MLKNRLLILVGLFTGSIFCMVALYGLTEYRTTSPNAFIRKLPPFKIKAEQVKDLKSGQLYIAGGQGNLIYLGDSYTKNLLFRLDLKTLKSSRVLLKAAKGFKVLEDAYVQMDSPAVFLMDGTHARVSVGSTTDYTLTRSMSTPNFTAAMALSPNSFLFRTVNGKNENVLVKQGAKHTLVVKDRLLRKQIDGLFCTDGILLNVPHCNKVFYVYYYRNQFLCLDTNLNLLYQGKTIDTNSQAKIKLGRIKSENQITMAAPPLYVNKQATANEGYLLIRSVLKADNETDKMHETAAAIDVYAVKDGRYQFSFYLPDFNGEKLTDFKVYDKTLVALFGHYIYTFKLNF